MIVLLTKAEFSSEIQYSFKKYFLFKKIFPPRLISTSLATYYMYYPEIANK